MDWNATTIKTYDNSAEELAEYFEGIGPRKVYIDLAFKLIGDNDNAKVIEIGCGDGRDAVEIMKRSVAYTGFDPSKKMIELARQRLPQASFQVDDAVSFKYPENVDLIFAFSSLLHLNSKELEKALMLISSSLNSDGLLYISLKEATTYREEVKQDKFGQRMFYYYSVDEVLLLCEDIFDAVIEIHETIGSTKWFELGLKPKAQ